MNDIASAYVEGLMAKCAEYGVDPEWLVKNAVSPKELLKLKKVFKADKKLPSFQQAKIKGVPDRVTKTKQPNAQVALAPKAVSTTPKAVKAPAAEKPIAPSWMATPKASKPAGGRATAINSRIKLNRGGTYKTEAGKLPPDTWDYVKRPGVSLRTPEDIALTQARATANAGLTPPKTVGGASAAPTAATPAAGATPTPVITPAATGTAPMMPNATVGGSGLPTAPAAPAAKGPGFLSRLGAKASPYAVGGGVALGGYGTYKGIEGAEPFFKDVKNLTPEEKAYIDRHPEIRDTIGGGGDIVRGTRNWLTGRPMNAPWEDPLITEK